MNSVTKAIIATAFFTLCLCHYLAISELTERKPASENQNPRLIEKIIDTAKEFGVQVR